MFSKLLVLEVDRSVLAADFDGRLGLVTCGRKGCSANLPKHNHPCKVAVDGLADRWSNEGEIIGLALKRKKR